tara:strand:+ start:11152 stop:12276 length:1125 start_codon:yes stop_codon:yes gene_type:complete
MNFDWLIILGIFCIGQCFFLSILYFIKDKRKSIVSYIIIVLLLIFTFDLIHDLAVHSRLIFKYPFLVGWASLFTFLKGPLIYFFIRSSFESNFTFRKLDLLHLGIFLYKNIENIIFEVNHSNAWKTNFLQEYYSALDNDLSLPNQATASLSDLWLLHPVIYLVITIIYLFNKRKISEPKNKKRLYWFYMMIIGYFIIYLTNVGLYILSSYYPFANKYYWSFSSIQFSILIICISYINLTPQFYSFFQKKKTYRLSVLNEEESMKLLTQIDTYIKENDLYLRKRLSIMELSKEMEVQNHYISYVINIYKNVNFQDYINQFRIEKAKKLIKDNFSKEFTFEALAKEVGFNSSTSFYRAFKKFTNHTPKEFIKNYNS